MTKDIDKARKLLISAGFDLADLHVAKGRDTGITDIPRLPNGAFAPTFMANGKRYTIAKPDDGIGIWRYNQMNKLLIPAQAGYDSFVSMYKAWDTEIAKVMAISGEGASKLAMANAVRTIKSNIAELDHMDYERWVTICTFFINREGEDTSKWSQADANAKIEDWCAANINVFDFFALALGRLEGYNEIFLAKIAELSPEKQSKFKVDIGLNTALTGGRK